MPAMKISKVSIVLAAFIAFSNCTSAMALTDKNPPRNEDTSESDSKSKQRKASEAPPARKRERCSTCRILM
jgi:hypothetical protein